MTDVCGKKQKGRTMLNFNAKTMRLYAVTESAFAQNATLPEMVEAALQGGVTCVQLREKNISDDAYIAKAMEMKRLCGRYGVPLIINDNPYVALKSGADGVHVGQLDMSASDVRKIIGSGRILGVTAKTAEQAAFAVKNGADYLGSGAVFASPTKPNAISITKDTLKEICRAVSVPVCAIGGITEANMRMLSDSGIDGVAMVYGIFANPDIEAACKRMRAACEAMFGGSEQ